MTADPVTPPSTPIFDTLVTELGLDWLIHPIQPDDRTGWFEPNAATK